MWPEGTFQGFVLAAGSFVDVTVWSSSLRRTLKALRSRTIISESHKNVK